MYFCSVFFFDFVIDCDQNCMSSWILEFETNCTLYLPKLATKYDV